MVKQRFRDRARQFFGISNDGQLQQAESDAQREGAVVDPAVKGTGFKEMPSSGEAGRVGPIGKEQVAEAESTLKKYKDGKKAFDDRIVENEQWYKGRHWNVIKQESKNTGDPEPASAWLLNSIANKHADAMDNYPEPAVLPREQSDEQSAKTLSAILPVVLEQNDFEQAYSDMWWKKLKTGTGVFGVYWNKNKMGGLGDIDIKDVDILQIYWEPGITDIQRSRNLFHITLMDRDIVEQIYPWMKGKVGARTVDTAEYVHDDTIDTTDKATVVDWYYKVKRDGKDVLHYCKYCSGEVLYASENDPEYMEKGFYDHGMYPFVFDTLFPEEGTPVGFGYIDVCKSPQIYIDKLDQVILKNAVMKGRPRFWVRGDGVVNEEEFADWKKDFVHYTGNANPNESIFPIQIPDLSAAVITVRDGKIDELKETSGNRDFSQGGTSSGVTAASAIAALQEAGSKLSRDMIKSAYRRFRQMNYLCIELMRQFYQEDRYFRVTGDAGQNEYLSFSGQMIGGQAQGMDFGIDLGQRMPVFDVTVTAQKASPFSTAVQNERAKELYAAGFFRPDLADQALAALDMMQFEGIEKVRARIAQNQTLFQQVQMLQQQMAKMALVIDAQNGTQIAQGVLAEAGGQQVGQPTAAGRGETENPRNGQAAAARTRAAENATPRA